MNWLINIKLDNFIEKFNSEKWAFTLVRKGDQVFKLENNENVTNWVMSKIA